MTSKNLIGVSVMARDAKSVIARIEELEQMGIPAAWLTTGGAGMDALTLFSAAAMRTQRIKLGTCIIPTWPRHPIEAVQQVQVIAQLAPGRFRLGVGPSHKPMVESMFGFDFQRPLTNLREYVTIVKKLLHEGAVDFDGFHYHAHAKIGATAPDVPVMASALQPKTFGACGEVADGAISWVSPAAYLQKVALPAMKAGAKKANRPVPPLIAHAPVCVHDDPGEVRQAAREQLSIYPRLPFYAAMLKAAGHGDVAGAWSDAMIESVVLSGDEARVAERLKAMFAMGMSEVLVTVVTAGADKAASQARTLKLLAQVSR
ncbi:MAG: LLM class flavin-dependent oxidoreductase [Chloroflexi bacterium]|nr:LLM class flavin-dependent oxidoreductase [Chloroflexota bacterium]